MIDVVVRELCVTQLQADAVSNGVINRSQG